MSATLQGSLIGVIVVGVLLTLVGERLERRAYEWLGKPAASLAFIALAFHDGVPTGAWGMALLSALVLSAVGDVALIAKGRGRGFFLGLVAFLLGHVAFAVAFASASPSLPRVALTALVMAPFAVWVARALVRRAEPRLGRAVVAYVSVITVMVALAVGAATSPWLPAAAVLFFVSDLFVARQRFVARAFVNRAVGLPLYYAAQILFALQA